MTKHAIFLQHRTKSGSRDDVQKIWEQHMQPAVVENPGHELSVYSFGDDPDRVCAFQVYSSIDDANAFLRSQPYRDYAWASSPLREGLPTVELLKPQWNKHGR